MNHTAKNSFIFALVCIPFIHLRMHTLRLGDIPEALIIASLAAVAYKPNNPAIKLASLLGVLKGTVHIMEDEQRAQWQKSLASAGFFASLFSLIVFGPSYLMDTLIIAHEHWIPSGIQTLKSLLKSIQKGIFYNPPQ